MFRQAEKGRRDRMKRELIWNFECHNRARCVTVLFKNVSKKHSFKLIARNRIFSWRSAGAFEWRTRGANKKSIVRVAGEQKAVTLTASFKVLAALICSRCDYSGQS